MYGKWKLGLLLLCAALLLSGCSLRTVDQLYCLPKRSDAETDLQSVIDEAMSGLSYCAPLYGENRQVTQKVDLDGDGVEECLVFSRGDNDKALKILIFCKLASGYVLMDTIEGYGFAFDFVEYAQIDGQPGLEIVVGRRVSNELMRSVSVYRFASERSRQLLSASCEKMVTCDLDGDGISELVMLGSGETEDSSGVLSLYKTEGDQLHRTATVSVSCAVRDVKRMQVGRLSDGLNAVFVTGADGNAALQTEIFTMEGRGLKDLWAGEPVQGLGSYRLFPQDLDGDGVLELPGLIPMAQHPQQQRPQYFVRWYALDSQRVARDKRFVYMDYTRGWYLSLEASQLERLTVVTNRDTCTFYAVGAQEPEKLLTIYALTDSDRETITQQSQYTILYKGDAVIFAAVLEKNAAGFGFTPSSLLSSFHMMRTELITDEN